MNMKRWCFTLLIALWSMPLFAFEGRVVSREGTPFPNATVSVLGYPGSSRTDENGFFTWQPDPSLPFEVLVTLPGGHYMAPVLVAEWPSQGPVTIQVAPLVAESVTVTGSAPHIESPPASGLNLIPVEAIAQHHPVRLTDAIENIPGTGQLSDLHAAVPSIRGLARGRTLILIDGSRVTTERRAGASATYLDPYFLEAIEVSRGPGSVAYGSDAFGGVIHARTRRPEPGAPLRLRFRGSLGAGLPERSAGVEVSRGFDEGGALFQARYRHFDAYNSPQGQVVNSQASDRGFLARLSHKLGSGFFSAGWQTDLGRDVGRPDNRSDVILTTYPVENSHRLTMSYDLSPKMGFSQIGLEGFLGAYRLVTDRETLATTNSPRSILQADVSAKDFSFRGRAVRPVGGAQLELGLDINGRYNLEALDGAFLYDPFDNLALSIEQAAIADANRNDTAAYASIEFLMGSRLTGSGGLRFDHVTTENRGGVFGDRATSNNAFSGFGSLKAEWATGLSLTGQVSRGFRDPTLSDRYYRGISGRGLVTGNPNLEPETALQFDMALRYLRGGMIWAVYAYHYTIEDLIERHEMGEDLFFFRNRGRARLRGLELEVSGEIGEDLRWQVGAQVANGIALDDKTPLDDIPVENVTVQLEKSLGLGHYVRVRGALFGRDEKPGPTERPTPRYGVVDVGGGWRMSRPLQLRFLVRNLFNQDYPISADRRAISAPGINAVVTLIAEF